MWNMTKNVVVEDVTEPMKILKKCRIGAFRQSTNLIMWEN